MFLWLKNRYLHDMLFSYAAIKPPYRSLSKKIYSYPATNWAKYGPNASQLVSLNIIPRIDCNLLYKYMKYLLSSLFLATTCSRLAMLSIQFSICTKYIEHVTTWADMTRGEKTRAAKQQNATPNLLDSLYCKWKCVSIVCRFAVVELLFTNHGFTHHIFDPTVVDWWLLKWLLVCINKSKFKIEIK